MPNLFLTLLKNDLHDFIKSHILQIKSRICFNLSANQKKPLCCKYIFDKERKSSIYKYFLSLKKGSFFSCWDCMNAKDSQMKVIFLVNSKHFFTILRPFHFSNGNIIIAK